MQDGHHKPVDPTSLNCGVGLRVPHVEEFTSGRASQPFVEIHSENYFCDGGPRHAHLTKVRQNYELSCHGVGLSLGSAEGVDRAHVIALKKLVDLYEPFVVSDHLSFSVVNGVYLNDLVPLPYTEEVFQTVALNVELVQDAVKRKLLVENPSTYLRFSEFDMTEPELLSALVSRTGCGLLVDVNNIYVCAQNHGIDPYAYVDSLPADAVGEIHVAGHSTKKIGVHEVLIDTHDRIAIEAVWDLLRYALARFGPTPVLFEWDGDIPVWSVLDGEAKKADAIIKDSIEQFPTKMAPSDVA